MRLKIVLAGCVAIAAVPAYPADIFPIKNPQIAIAIAKQMCQGKADPSLAWQAILSLDGSSWDVSTMPGIKKSGDPLWTVTIPVNGPSPKYCAQSLYTLLNIHP